MWIRIQSRQASGAASRQGAMLPLIASMMVVFMVMVAFSIDIAHMHLAKMELRAASDAAAKAAAQELSRTLDIDRAVQAGVAVASANQVNNQPLLLGRGDFTFGRSVEDADSGRFVFRTQGDRVNSVLVVGRRSEDSRSGAVPLFFGNVFGVPFFEPEAKATATFLNRDVMLVVDRSGSMLGQKFIDLQAAIAVFIATLQTTTADEFVGLASYSDNATIDLSLTANLPDVVTAVSRLPVFGFTSISRGMDAGFQNFGSGRSRRFVERTMIVMTDGIHNAGPEPRNSARRIAADGIVIHTITFGTDADRRRMREIADIGGGRSLHADDGEELRRVFRDVALSLSTIMTE